MMMRYARATSDKKLLKEQKKRKRTMKSVAEAKEDEEQRKSNNSCANESVSVLPFDSNPGVKLMSTGESVKAAFKSVKVQGNNSAVFNNLFHKSEKKSADDLFMRVSGIRGTLG